MTSRVSGFRPACGQDKPAVCAQADELKASVQHLRDVTVTENGIDALTSALRQVKTELEQLGTEAKSEFQPRDRRWQGIGRPVVVEPVRGQGRSERNFAAQCRHRAEKP
jgi:hypothetical protein